MKVEQYVDDILLQLGFPVVDVEISDYVFKIVDMAFREIKHYITDTKTITLSYANKIHINSPKINTVVYLERAVSNYQITEYADVMYLMSATSFGPQSLSFQDYARYSLTQMNKNAISTDLDFYWDKYNNDLYVNANYPKPGGITVVYIPEYTDIEEVTEPFWENLLRRLALALTKQALGRVRGKFTLNSATYNLDADQLLSESQQELQEIRTYLNENSDLLLPID